MSARLGSRWAIVLAAGEGRRLASLTRALHRADRPKQFARIDGNRSLLQATMHRIRGLFSRERTVVIVGAAQEGLAREQLEGSPGTEIVLQPQDRGTAAGILLPLTRVLARDPEASVAIIPSDHFVAHPRPFLGAVKAALAASTGAPSGVALVGARPDYEEPEYGWIVAGDEATDRRTGSFAVRRFMENPSPETTRALFCLGSLWNTFVSAGSATAYRKLFEAHLPDLAAAFARFSEWIGTPQERERLESLYRSIPAADFSRAVSEKDSGLAVVTLAESGWSDWGSPARVFRSLAGSSALPALLRRLEGRLEAEPLLQTARGYAPQAARQPRSAFLPRALASAGRVPI